MTDRGESDHWAQLASELGAEPPVPQPEGPKEQPEEERERREVEAAARGPMASPGPQGPCLTPPAQRTVQDWSRLAEELGVVRQADDAEVSQPEPVESADELTEAESVFGNDETGTADATWGAAEDAAGPVGAELRAVDSFVEPEVADSRPVETPSEPRERKPGKKGRRRRPRSRKPAGDESGEAAAETTDVDSPGDLAVAESVGEHVSAPSDTPTTASPVSDDMEEPGRSKRRRRRRSSGRKKAAAQGGTDALQTEADSTAVGEEDQVLEPTDREPIEAREAEDEDEDEGAEGTQRESARDGRAKKRHRGIPSWQEAVGIIISANLESRAKRPNGKFGSRSRGGRGRGGREKPNQKTS